jgi:aromatic-L-amino-acid decarboxylase
VNADEFRKHGHDLVDWIAEYLEHSEKYPVLSSVKPGDIVKALPSEAPEDPEPFDRNMADFERVLLPGITHWNHPGFMAYFAITGSEPGVLADFLSAALNQQAMLWRTSPAATELETVALGWLRRLIGLPDAFDGVIYDTASTATLHALVAAREAAVADVRARGLAGRGVPQLAVYCSDQTHSVIDKAVITAGLGHDCLRKIETDDRFEMRAEVLAAALARDRANGVLPVMVVATIGTTSTTSVDPVAAIADLCEREQVWLHVDAAYAGVAAMVASHAHVLDGADRADSLVVNPHKWLFTPFDLTAFYCRRMDVLRAAFALTPLDILKTREPGEVRNLMDTGFQLGRRFRSLKLWMILRSYGAAALRDTLAEHMRLARELASWVDAHPDFERLAPVPFSVVCFRCRPADASEADIDAFNERLVELVNTNGDVLVSHTRLRGRFVIRVAIGHLKTTERHVRRAWDLIVEHAATLERA